MKLKERFKKIGVGSRQLILSGLILFIALAGYINLNYSDQDEVVEVAQVQEEVVPVIAQPAIDEFSNMKMDRDKTKSESMAVFREIVDNDSSTDEARNKAQADMSEIAKNSESERMIESILNAKGFSETIVYISSGKVSVIVKSEGLVPTEITQIKDIVIEVTGFDADDIKVVEKL